MLTEICAEIHNYFCKPEKIESGTFTISNGSIEPLSFLQSGQFYRIVGSVFNDGVWQYGEGGMTDETFEGYIWPMSVPKDVVALAQDIEAWLADDSVQSAINSPFSSESFGGYTYTKGNVSRNSEGTTENISWQSQFGTRLNPYRKLREI